MLTRTGWTALGLGVALLVAASVLGWLALATLAIALLLAVAVGLAWVLVRPSFEVEHRVGKTRVTVGDPDDASVTVTNPAGRPSLPMTAFDQVGATTVRIPIPRLAAGASTSKSYPLPTGRRAILEVGPLEIRRSDPFGLVRADQGYGRPEVVYVHPRRHALRPMPATLERSLEGPTSDTAPRGSQVFHALREYVPGDPRRHIHWKTSARTGTLMVRQHVDTSLPDLTVLLDTRPGRHSEASFEEAVEAAASLLVSCASRGFPARLRTPDGQVFEPAGGTDPATWFLDRLAGVDTDVRGDLIGTAMAMQAGTGGFALVVVTGRPTAGDARALVPLTRNFDSVTVADLHPDHEARSWPYGVERIEAGTSLEFATRWNQGRR